MANIINNCLDLLKVILDYMIWGAALYAGVRYLINYVREHSWEDNFWVNLLIRIAIILGMIIIPCMVVNGFINGLKLA